MADLKTKKDYEKAQKTALSILLMQIVGAGILQYIHNTKWILLFVIPAILAVVLTIKTYKICGGIRKTIAASFSVFINFSFDLHKVSKEQLKAEIKRDMEEKGYTYQDKVDAYESSGCLQHIIWGIVWLYCIMYFPLGIVWSLKSEVFSIKK